MKVYRGAASAARAYVEADRSRVDDYYLAEGTGLARRFAASPDAGVIDLGTLDGDGYERWVAGHNPDTGAARGRLRKDGNAVRFVEITVNGPKSWSLAAALNRDVAAAYEAAQDRAADQIIGWVAEHATTRVGPRGRQVQVPVERVEAVTVRHFTSRAGDPHRHLHLQVNARVFAAGTWRGLHTVGFRDSIEALNGIGHAAVVTDPEFRAALAAAGLTLDPASGEVAELAPYVGAFSERAAQIGRNVDRYEAQWRKANPGQEPGPVVRQGWDRRAWKDARPDKVIPAEGAAMIAAWVEQLHDLGYRDPLPQPGLPLVLDAPRVGALNREAAIDTVLTRLGARRSAWNLADVRGQVEQWIAATGLVAITAVRVELAEDLTARVVDSCIRLPADRECVGVPEHIRSLTSAEVLRVEAEIVSRLVDRSHTLASVSMPDLDLGEGLDGAQRRAVTVLTGDARLVVVEGAAGAGKTTTLAATHRILTARGRRMLVVTPTLKAARVAGREVGAAGSVAWLVHQHGFRWDADGRWTRVASTPADEAALARGDLLLCDEAGMLDQDTARALLTVVDEMGARLALVGDRHQLPAVGRGGVLDLATRWVTRHAHIDLDEVHRFADPEYAAITLALRTGSATYTLPPAPEGRACGQAPVGARGEPVKVGEGLTTVGRDRTVTRNGPPGEPSGERVGEVWGALWRRDQIRIYASEGERTHALARLAVEAILARHSHRDGRDGREDRTAGVLVIADTREQTAALNGAIRDQLVAVGHLDDAQAVVTGAGERLGVGDRVATRRNDPGVGVANRDVWTVTAVGADDSLTLRGPRPADLHTVSASYARDHVELAYATTVYGAQGETTGVGHLLLGEHTTAASAYTGMTRGRHDNVVHLVAEDRDEARQQWEEVFGRDRADLGPAAAARRVAEDVDRYGTQQPTRPLEAALAELRTAWTKRAELAERREELVGERDALRQVATIQARYAPERDRLRDVEDRARRRWVAARAAVADLESAIDAATVDLRTRVWDAWAEDLHRVQPAAAVLTEGSGRLGQRRRQVHRAAAEMAAFAQRWLPVLPDLPVEPATLASQLPWLPGRRVENHINAYVGEQVAAAYPPDAVGEAERDSARALDRAEQERRSLDQAYYRQLQAVGHAAHDPDAARRLVSVTNDLTTLDRDLDTATRRVKRLEHQPVVRALPPGSIAAERHAWDTDRTAQRHAADLQTRWLRPPHQARPMELTHPSPKAPNHGIGIGR